MKKLLTLLSIIFCLNTKAQYVTIPDTSFVNNLYQIVPSAMNGNQLDTTNILVTTTTHTINLCCNHIVNLFGIQYFTSLVCLKCTFCSYLSNIPALPNSLTYLDCSYSPVVNLPTTLPHSLTHLDCSYNGGHLTTLPALPNSLKYLDCGSNSGTNPLTSLPALPNSLTYLQCNYNKLTNLPALPNSLDTLSCDNNYLTSLPALPNSLVFLDCDYNYLTGLPSLLECEFKSTRFISNRSCCV